MISSAINWPPSSTKNLWLLASNSNKASPSIKSQKSISTQMSSNCGFLTKKIQFTWESREIPGKFTLTLDYAKTKDWPGMFTAAFRELESLEQRQSKLASKQARKTGPVTLELLSSLQPMDWLSIIKQASAKVIGSGGPWMLSTLLKRPGFIQLSRSVIFRIAATGIWEPAQITSGMLQLLPLNSCPISPLTIFTIIHLAPNLAQRYNDTLHRWVLMLNNAKSEMLPSFGITFVLPREILLSSWELTSTVLWQLPSRTILRATVAIHSA